MANSLNQILSYFPELSPHQQELLSSLKPIYEDWNTKINLISRRDMDNFYLHHVLFSLSVKKLIHFLPGTRLIDIGTGGGFPGIPLAIAFPECSFTLLDSIGKKIKVVKDVSDTLKLENIEAVHGRSEQYKGQFDFILGRAVTAFPGFIRQNRHLLSTAGKNTLSNGILYLTGGESASTGLPRHSAYREWPLTTWFSEEFFVTKKIIHFSPA